MGEREKTALASARATNQITPPISAATTARGHRLKMRPKQKAANVGTEIPPKLGLSVHNLGSDLYLRKPAVCQNYIRGGFTAPRVTMADSEPRGRRIAVLAVGLLRGLMDERARRKSSTFLRAVAPTHCFAVFEALPSEESCTPDALRHARTLLSADGARVAQVRLVETSELRQAACSCMACPANATATKQPSGANACRGMYLQFHKVLLAFRMLEGAERDGARFDAVLRIRMDLGFLVLPVLEAQLQHAASTTTAVLLQRDAAWLASRRVATAVAVAWSIMGEQLGLLRSSAGSYPLFQALQRLDWSRLASSCWAFTSKFIPCLPFPADWPGGWSLARVREMATDASDLEAALSNRSRIWIAASQKCFWIHGRAPAHRLGFNPEPEVHLGLALFVVPSHGVALAFTADHDNCTSFGSVPWSKGRTYGCTTKTIAKPAAGEPSSTLIATNTALAAAALSEPAAAESSTRRLPFESADAQDAQRLWDDQPKADALLKCWSGCLKRRAGNITTDISVLKPHYEQLLHITHNYRPQQRGKRVVYQDYSGPRLEDYWINGFLNTSFSLFAPLVPLFVHWTELAIQYHVDSIGRLRRHLRRDVLYFTVSAFEGVTAQSFLPFHVIVASSKGEPAAQITLPHYLYPQTPGFDASGQPLWRLPPGNTPHGTKRAAAVVSDAVQEETSLPAPCGMGPSPESAELAFVGSLDTLDHRASMHAALQSRHGTRYRHANFPPCMHCNDTSSKDGTSPCWRVHMLASAVNLCPVGTAAVSYRLYEALQQGSIPVYVHDNRGPHVPYANTHADVGNLGWVVHFDALEEWVQGSLANLRPEEIAARRARILAVRETHYSPAGAMGQLYRWLKAPHDSTRSDLRCKAQACDGAGAEAELKRTCKVEKARPQQGQLATVRCRTLAF